MSSQSSKNLDDIAPRVDVVGCFMGCLVYGVVFGACVGGVLDVVATCVVVGAGFGVVVGCLIFGLVSVRGRRQGSQAPVGFCTTAPREVRSLWWVRGLLPGDEGAAWVAEVTSLLAEAPDKSTRRRYVRGYRRNVPQLIWTSWAEHLRASRQRELL